jgi:hypothetical protein
MSTDEPLEGKSVRLADSLTVEIKSVKAGLSSVYEEGKTFSPMDKSKVLAKVTVAINNASGSDYNYGELTRLEMAFSGAGNIHFAQRAILLTGLPSSAKVFGKNTVTNETLYFTHDKRWVPVAMTVDRLERTLLVDEADADYVTVTANLDKYANIEIMMSMVKEETPFEEIDAFRVSNGIDINDEDHNGYSLLHTAIKFHHDAVLFGAIENHADIHQAIAYGYNASIEPVDFAVLSDNRNAVAALIKAGANLNREQKNTGDSLPVIAVRSDNVPALKLIKEFSNIDLTSLMIPMNWSPAIPALKFARDRKLTEMAAYLESLNTAQ